MLTDTQRNDDFPALKNMVYLNTAAEGIPPRSVRDALIRYSEDKALGMDGREGHAAERSGVITQTAELYGMKPDEIAICSCTSEAFNLLSTAIELADCDEVIINDLDFPSAVTPWLQPGCRARIQTWRSVDGILRIDDLSKLVNSHTRLLTMSLVSFYNGYRADLDEVIAVLRRDSDALLAVDVTQALGRIPIAAIPADFVVSSTHKWILASHGGGLVGVRSEHARELTARTGGWFNITNAFNADRFEYAIPKRGAASYSVGMPNYPAIYAINAGLGYIRDVGVEAIDAHARPLVAACIEGLKKLPVELLTYPDERHLAGIVAFRHPRAPEIQAALRERHIHIMGDAGRLRVAIHGYNTIRDIETFLAALAGTLDRV